MDFWDKFVELVKHNFAFLESDFHFKIAEIKHPFIWYNSKGIKVRIYYSETGNWSHELDLAVERLGDDPKNFPAVGVTEMILLSPDWREAESYRAPFPKSCEELETEVPKLADVLRRYGSKILKADHTEFARLERLRREAAERMNKPG